MEYNNTHDTAEEGQAYLRMHPEMWQYMEQRGDPNMKSSTLDSSDLIPNYPAAAIIPEANAAEGQESPSQFMPNYPGGSPLYGLPSQPELTESVKYPGYHNVRKHGKYSVPQSEVTMGGDMSNGNGVRDLNINVDRRTSSKQDTQDNSNFWPSGYFPPGAAPKYPEDDLFSKKGRFSMIPDSPPDDLEAQQNEDINLGRRDEGSFGVPHPDPRWKREAIGSYLRKALHKRHIGPHDMDGIQRLISTGNHQSL